jgi:uncharacterized protein (DUF2237 family)
MSQSGTIAASGFATLAGHFVLQPGQSAAIVGTRPIAAAGLLSQLFKGQHFAATQARLGHVFTLCAHAHQRACALAFAAAEATQDIAPLPLALLRWETARDHLRSIALEWPQRLGEPSLQAAAMDWLRTCPLPLAGAVQPGVAQAWASLAALRDWLTKDACFPAQCLARWHAQCKDLAVPLSALDVLSDDAATQQEQLRLLGQAIAADSGFTQLPHWQGACAETGPWTRLRHTRRAPADKPGTDLRQALLAAKGRLTADTGNRPHADALPVSAWTRLEARWQELQDIASAPTLADDATHDPLLSSGALALGDGQAIAWCEMARGLLLHWVQLDSHGAVAQYRVLAPTEWNFHPQGALALALAARAAQDVAAAQTLAAAFDPCVECSVAAPPAQEPAHA